MKQANRRHSIFELTVIAGLVLAACWSAFTVSAAGLLPLFHGMFLITGYLLARLIVGRLNRWVGNSLFTCAALMLLADISVQLATGLHLNLFVVSVMLQPGIGAELGFSGIKAAFLIMALVTLSLYGARALKEPSFPLSGRKILMATALTAISAQLLYGALYFRGVAEIEDVRRKLPFFTAPHPYYSAKIFGLLLDKNTNNPFAIATGPAETFEPPTTDLQFSEPRKNILLIVIDSLRALDIAEDPSLAPNVMKWAERGQFSLDHYSVANCTQFSFYSMFTGKIPTSFGQARRSRYAVGMAPTFAANGYAISTAEANSLDWYDTAKILFPTTSKRHVSAENGALKRDQEVTKETLKKLAVYRGKGEPFFHLAYYFGPHYPYDPVVEAIPEPNNDKYKRTIGAVDQELGKLFEALEVGGLLKNTLVIVTADHGEEFQKTGRTGHASRLSDEQVKVPFLLINQTKQTPGPAPVLKSHLDIAPYLLSQMTHPANYQPQNIILANCGYDYPSGFALFTAAGRSDFLYRDGYLSPIAGPDGRTLPEGLQREAAATLLEAIKEARPTGSPARNRNDGDNGKHP